MPGPRTSSGAPFPSRLVFKMQVGQARLDTPGPLACQTTSSNPSRLASGALERKCGQGLSCPRGFQAISPDAPGPFEQAFQKYGHVQAAGLEWQSNSVEKAADLT